MESARQPANERRLEQRLERWLPWVLRAAWVAVLVVGGSAVESATAGRSGAVAAVATYGGLAVWLIGVAAMAVPAVVSLTATRVVVPLAIPAAGLTLVAGADAVGGTVFVAHAGVATLVAGSGEVGRAFVQASAYGEEDRHLLRPPAAYALAAGLAWVVGATALIAGPLLLAVGRWVIGAAGVALAVAVAVWAWPRWHRLACRWFVVVPVGAVVHDPLVLAETLMLRRHEIAAIRLAPADTAAADLTGPAGGHAVEIVTVAPVTAIFAATPREPRGTAIHLTACLVAPSRPGRALGAAAGRRLPVG